ncbi:hypothetical protein [Devosia sp. A449]
MSKAETDVRAAARALHRAIADGRATGLSISWPSSAEGLASIAISETARAVSIPPAAPAKPRRANPKVTK